MKRKWFPVLFLPLLLAAEDFEAYPDTAALRRVWQEFDAGNPAPDTVAIGALNGKAMQVTAARDYSILWRELANPFGAKAAGIKLAVKGDAANPADAVLTVAVRPEKGGADLGRMVIPLRSGGARTVTVPVAGLGKLDKFAVLLMFNKTGGTLAATVDDVAVAAAELQAVNGFAQAADNAALQQAWPGFDAGNPGPEQVAPATVDGRPAMRCVTGGRTYAAVKHEVKNPAPGRAAGLLIRLSGAPGNAKSGVIVFGARRDEGQPNFAEMQIVPTEKAGEYVLNSPEFAKLDRFLVVIAFHKTAGQFDVTIEKLAVQCLQ